jgi:preprotein translocase subunit SecY
MKIWRKLSWNRQIVNRLLFTLLALAVYRLMSNIPLPGIDMQVYMNTFAQGSTSEAKYLLSLFTGGQLETPSIVGLGIGVYITASIIVQLLTSVIPRFEELSKDGTRGKYVLDRYTRLLTLPLALLYSVGYLLLLSQQALGYDLNGTPLTLIPRSATGGISASKIIFMTLVLTAGSLFIMWLAELVTEKGIANGASLMIMFGILGTLPALIESDIRSLAPVMYVREALNGNPQALLNPKFLVLIGVAIAIILLVALIVFITESTRKVAVQYARRQRSGVVQESHLPLKINQNGVMPIIFASALLTMPQLIVPILSSLATPDSPLANFTRELQNSFLFNTASAGYSIAYFVLIVLFSIFYIFISFKPDQVAENLQKVGGFIPGIRPGKSTENHLTRILIRLNVVGAFFLGFIALIPVLGRTIIFNAAEVNFALLSTVGGTSILIVIGVVLEALRQVNALKATQNYERFI